MRQFLSRKFAARSASFLFLAGGSFVLLASMLWGPSFWYIVCFFALPGLGAVWTWKPQIAAALSVGPLLALVIWLHYLSGRWLGVGLLCFALAIFLVMRAICPLRKVRIPALVSLCFVALAFSTDRMFTNRVTIRKYQMQVSLDGKAPWGEVFTDSEDRSPPVVLYRRVPEGFCYNTFRSQELLERLSAKHAQTVSVEYNIFADFGRERGYNVRSVDGLLLNDNARTIHDYERAGGMMVDNGSPAKSTCP